MFNFPWARASLRAKLLAAHLIVVAVGVVTVLLITELLAPPFFDIHMASMIDHAGMMGSSGMMNGTAADAALRAAYLTAVTQAVLVAGTAATLAAVLVSLFVSARIVGPVQGLVAATRRIAAGHYAERVPWTKLDREDELGQLAGSFNAMAAALETTERRRVELLGDVAHELRTPISTLEGYLEGLLDGVVEPSPETWARLHGEAGRLHRLVSDLQDLSRAESRQLALKLQAVDPAQITEIALARVRQPLADKGLELVTQIPAPLPAVRADLDRAAQALTNLLANALRYTPAPGKVTLAIGRTPAGNEVLFQVADSGIGLAAEHLPHLFERFYRVDKSRSRAAGGSGIGLTIAQAVVEAMGGRIWAESPGPGQGSTFSFTLPLAEGCE